MIRALNHLRCKVLPRPSRELWSFVENPALWISCLGNWFSHISEPCRHELDLYRDLRPFDSGVEKEAHSYNAILAQDKERNLVKEPHMMSPLFPTKSKLTRSKISASFVLVKKSKGELLHDLVLDLSKEFESKDFYVASSGYIDVIGSGLVLLCCGKTIAQIEYFDRLSHVYQGTLRLGQTSTSYDLKTHVHSSYPWRHISDEHMSEVAQTLVGEIRLPPDPMIATYSASEHKTFNLTEVADRSDRPCAIYSLDIHRSSSDSPEVILNLVADAYMSPAALAHEFGQRLGCGAVLTNVHKSAIGDYTEDMAWDEYDIRSAFQAAKTGKIYYPEDNKKGNVLSKSMWYLNRVTGQNWSRVLRGKKKRPKLKPFEARYLKAVRQDMEARGLISDKEIMKRKLKKKAIKLVANMNVDEIERVYEQMLDE